jgi:serine/threonine-protein kinase
MRICPTCQNTYSDDVEFCPRDGARLATQGTETEAQLAAGLSRRYRIVRRLGAGGMGTVFLAQQIGVGNRPVALKVLNRKLLDDPQFLLRFHNEAASTGLIHHPNVVTIYESAQADDGTPYIAMEYLEGETLRQILEVRGALAVLEVRGILHQAARGLSAAHKLGIIHRDLKPDNFFLTRGDEGEPIVKVLDFGIAKLRESATHTQTGMVLGTPAYMSYEQASGMRSDELDARSDVYSLGVVVYEMLSGRVPFHSDTPLGYVRKHMLEDPPPFRAVAPGSPVPLGVERAVMKALVKDRDQRYPTVLDFSREFAFVASSPSQADSPTPFAPTRRDEPEAAVRGSVGFRGEPSAAPVALVARQADLAVKTPPPLDVSPEQTGMEAAGYDKSPDDSSQPAVTSLPSPGKPELRPEPKWTPPQLPGPRLRKVQEKKSSRVGIATVVAAVVIVILAALLWNKRPGDPNRGAKEAPAPIVRNPPANPSPPVPQIGQNPRVVVPEPANPPPSTDATGVKRKVKAAIAEGDTYFDNGKYDRAIAAYEAGFAVDPANPQLRQRVQRAKTAKAADNSVPQ